MTPAQRQNFQQGWLDLAKRQGVAAAIAIYLVWQVSDKLPDRIDAAVSTTVSAHATESDAKLQQLIELMTTVVKGQEQDRALIRQQIRYQQLTCLYVAHNDDQKSKCLQ